MTTNRDRIDLSCRTGLAVIVTVGSPSRLSADTIDVPNGNFETLYKPGTTIEGNIAPNGWSQGVGPDCPIDSEEYQFDDGTTGDVADIPGWIGADRDGWIANGGTYGRDETTGNLQGSVASQFNFTEGGLQCYLANGGSWGNPAGGLIVSDGPLATIEGNRSYTVSMMSFGAATPLTLDLLADGVALTPSSTVDPVLSADWQEYSRTYDVATLAGYVGQDMTIQLGVGRGAAGTQSQFDDVTLSYEGTSDALQAGDADMDCDFDQLDLVKVQQGGKYLIDQDATWGEGDWNGAPGGSVEDKTPPPGDGRFDQLDIIAALGTDLYLQGTYCDGAGAAALAGPGTPGNEQTDLVYDARTGELSVDPPASTNLTSINIDSAAGLFDPSQANMDVLDGSFDNVDDGNIFKATFGEEFGAVSFGNVMPLEMSEEDVIADLTAVGSLAGGGGLGGVGLIYIPEPSTLALLGLSLPLMLIRRRR